MPSVDKRQSAFGQRTEHSGCPYARALQRRRFKRTMQREVIWDVLCRTEGHPTPDDLFAETINLGHKLSMATIYRTLRLFRQNGLVRRVEFGDGQSRYEQLRDAAQHLHLVCDRCGRTLDVADPAVIDRYRELADTYAFRIHQQATCLYGICDACRKKAMTNLRENHHD
ncbi:Fur family transcriptional regulator [Pseudodesulfovibrio sediminis]|uniref:Transcriptional repressor n=1 Tax=Pseudodesulfovibrio sediminis TaxID=2810563 RepID=A0ABM7P5G1_9BACT|nr:transcriptional repressor [Pseudodesulfovibrio sediminis]BCS88123.1 transcriptional repressor [Pseudodesulfovibrio sediminis]